MLTDADATRENILASFNEWLIDGSAPGDRVVFYFSGHGFQLVDESGDEPDDPFDEGLAPHNVTGDLADGRLDNIVIDDEIGELVEKLQGREVWIVVDACFSGTITRSAGVTGDGRSGNVRARTLTPRGPVRASTRSIVSSSSDIATHKVKSRLLQIVPDNVEKSEKEGSLFAWTATTSAQLAYESSDIGGGVFTLAFVEGLKDKAADFDNDGKVTAAELLTFVRKRSDEFCQSEPMCRDGAGLTPEVTAPKEQFTAVLAPQLFTNLNSQAGTGAAGAETDAASATVSADTPVDTATGLFSHDNDFPIEVSILPGDHIAHGHEVTIKVSSAETGYLVLFDQSPDGSLRQIFPNEYSGRHAKDGLIHAGSTVFLPDPSYGFAFEATDKGKSALIALVIDDQIDFGNVLTEHPEFDIIADSKGFLSEIAEILLKPKVTPDPDKPNGRHRWSFATLDYLVE